ncbi:MAG: ATP-binding protein, partial [Cyclobacteriaceae bacterium]|nr:ATP-binding protein [Cyclobacteriaceae bacterium]
LIEDIDEEKVSVLLFDKLNNLWVGTWGNGLIKIINPGKENEKIVRYKNNPNDAESIKCDHIMALMEDDEGTIWVGTWEGGLEKIVRINGNISFKHYYRNDPHINDKTVIDIYQTKDKALWVGTTGNGLMRLHREMDLLQTWDEMGEYSMQLSSKYVNFIQEDPGGNLWVGTRNGLNKLDPLTGKISYYNEKNGFLNDNMISLAVDANHYYWITSEKGISRFNPLNGIVQNFSEIDGLSPIKFRAKARMNDGENVLFGGTYGFMYFNPTGFNAEYYIPQIAITHFDMKGGREKIGARKSLTYYSKEEYLEFNHDENILTFDFSVLSYRSPVKNHYAYILEGYDKEWIYMKDKRSVTYANLPSGEYTLKVKGAGYDGIWNEKGNSLGFVIKRPPWGTWWAYGIYVILVFVILVSYRKFIINREKLRTMLHLKKVEADQLNEINQLKSRFFSNVSHELKTPLTLIQSPIKVLKSGLTNSPEKMFEVIERNLGRLKKLIEQLLDLSKIESGVLQLSKENTDLLTLIREIIFQFEPYLQEKNVSLELITNNEHLIIHLDKEKTTEVITNLLDNAIKFSHEEGKITISVLTENENLMIKIRNTGMGVSEEDRKQIFNRYYQKDIPGMINSGVGIGLSLSKELVEMHGGTLDLESEYSKYAEFIISLPWKCLIS